MYFILFIAIAVASYAVQASLKSKFSTYSKTPLSNGMTGAQVAEKMLRDNGINNVKVTQNILFFNCGPTSCLRLVLHQT